jgi:Tfp pilus assembly protein PilF
MIAKGQPASALIQLELGRTYLACGRDTEAEVVLMSTLEADAGLAGAWQALSELHQRAGATASADAAYARFRRLTSDPTDLADAYFAFDQNRLELAESLARQRLQVGTNQVAAHTLLAAIALRREDVRGEQASLQRVLELAPSDNTAREQLVRLLLREGRVDEALPAIERLLEAEPLNRTYLLHKADALRIAERHEEALTIVSKLLAADPNDTDYWLFAGNLQRYSGESEEAVRSYRRILQMHPGHGAAYLALANMKTFRFADEDVKAMRVAAATPDADLEFALAKALEDEGQYAESFQHYAKANSLTRASFNYDAGATSAFVQRFKNTFTLEFFGQRADWGSAQSDPIFIVGLPRSGSTLIEQILASHPQVEGTRELPYIPIIARELAGPFDEAASYPQNISTLTKAQIASLADRYLASARRHRHTSRPRFIDKMHGNFVSIGLLQLMFPKSTIIDSRRHPMGSGFACFKQNFNPGMNFAYDLKEIAQYYRDYVELMAHIDHVLPGRAYTIYYEHLVASPEREVRRLLAHCRLPFDAATLNFHENARVAQTLSSEQVRQPIYTDAAEHWRHYEPWLSPLNDLLGDLIVAYPPQIP